MTSSNRKKSAKGGSEPHSNSWQSQDPNLEREQSRYSDPIASRELLLDHLTEASEPLSAARIAKRLGLQSDAQRAALAKRLAAMVRDGQIDHDDRGFSSAGSEELIAGKVRGRPNGEAIIIPDDGSAALALVRADMATLMHQDRVEVRPVGMNDRGRRVARLIRRLGDGPKRIAGIWRAGHG